MNAFFSPLIITRQGYPYFSFCLFFFLIEILLASNILLAAGVHPHDLLFVYIAKRA